MNVSKNLGHSELFSYYTNIMLRYTILFFVTITAATSKVLIFNAEPEQLQLVNVVFRHGDRAPANDFEIYPNDPNGHRKYFAERGQLTDVGKMRCETLGKHLHNLYGGFVSESYVADEIYGRSDTKNRSKECLKQALCGWYSEDHQLQNSEEGCQPKMTVVDSDNDKLLRPRTFQSFKTEKERVMELPEVQNRMNLYKDFLENITRLTGKEYKTAKDMLSLYNIFSSQSSQGWELPSWANDIYPTGILSNGTALIFQLEDWDREIRKVNGGLLMRKIVNNMLTHVENQGITKTKIYMYSAHEGNVASALIYMGLFEPHVPKFTSAVIFELLSRDHQYYVRVRYYEGIPAKSTIKTIPGCVELCPLQQFIKLIEDNLASSEDVQGYD